jgi:hypothetical protein
VAEEDFTAAVEADSAVARQEVSMVAEEVTMATAADIPTSVTMEVATTEDAVVMVGTGAMDGMADIGAILTTVTDGDWVLVLGGRIGVGDTRIATATALGITLPTLTTTRIIVVRDTHVLPTRTMTLRLRILTQNQGATQQSLRDRRRALQTLTTRPVMSLPLHRVVRFS